jgi:hypothetical protein
VAERHILAAEGGWLDQGRRALDELIAGLTGKERPRICCLPTVCWFECSVTDSYGGLAPLHDGLGFLAAYTRLVADAFPPGLVADDGVALWFRGTELAEVVSWRPGARAYRVGPDGETPLEPRLLA